MLSLCSFLLYRTLPLGFWWRGGGGPEAPEEYLRANYEISQFVMTPEAFEYLRGKPSESFLNGAMFTPFRFYEEGAQD